MSEIPKSKRKESKLEVLHKAYKLRARITNELICSFAYSQKKFESHLDKSVRHIRDETEREETKETLRKMEENFDLWVIKREREDILKYTKGIINHIVSANTISPVFMTEFEERRKLKSYKRLLDRNEITYKEIEDNFKSWICSYWKTMSNQQLYNMNALYKSLFGKEVKWKKKNSRLHWLMNHKLKDFQ